MPSYAGVQLCQCTPELSNFIESRIPLEDAIQFAPVPYLDKLNPDLPYPDQRDKPVKIGSLWWPQGASRWAVGHFLATELQLIDIYKVIYPAGQSASVPFTPSAQPLVLDDGTQSIAPKMWMLPRRPIAQWMFGDADATKWLIGTHAIDLTGKTSRPDEPAYLLTFVDDRFYWWQNDNPSVMLTPNVTQWVDLISQIATDLGIVIGTDPIPAAYGVPQTSILRAANFLPMLLDMICFNIGMRLIRKWDTGDVFIQAPSTGLGSAQTQLAANTANRMAGGLLSLDAK